MIHTTYSSLSITIIITIVAIVIFQFQLPIINIDTRSTILCLYIYIYIYSGVLMFIFTPVFTNFRLLGIGVPPKYCQDFIELFFVILKVFDGILMNSPLIYLDNLWPKLNYLIESSMIFIIIMKVILILIHSHLLPTICFSSEIYHLLYLSCPSLIRSLRQLLVLK